MTASAHRPDPDALLLKIKSEERQLARARLRIFFGFAPGVGKTYRMLQTAHELRSQGVDVAVGIVETHGRPETAALLAGLEVIPRRKITYRDRELEEFNLDAALTRKPKVLLLDELAHTNAPGSRHAKRWQDVLELLDAGIDVYTTLNVQHVESLNDVIAQITQVHVRETVPDAILERAGQIEVIDVSAEELLTRLQEGKVYLPEQAARATQRFFQRGNLLALRELALRQTAHHVDEDMQAHRQHHNVAGPWPTHEKILVCIGAESSSARLIRAAKRMASELHAPWDAVHVEALGSRALRPVERECLESHIRLVESLGGGFVRLSGNSVRTAILTHARSNGITLIILGKPARLSLAQRLRGPLFTAIARGSRDIDVHVITIAPADSPVQPMAADVPSEEDSLQQWYAYSWSILMVAAATLAGAALHFLLAVPDIVVLYLLAVMFVALLFGRGPSLAAAACSVAAYDFFFVAPRFTFAIADGKYALSFAMMFGVAMVMGTLTLHIRRQEQAALQREQRMTALYALSRELAAAITAEQVAAITARQGAEVFDAMVLIAAKESRENQVARDPHPAQETQGTLVVLGAHPSRATLVEAELGVAKWVFEHGLAAGGGTQTLPGARGLYLPIKIADAPLGVLALFPRKQSALTSQQREFLEAFCRQAAFALERIELAEKARLSGLQAKTEELRSSLLSAVSHDLRTPLSAITGAATTLRNTLDLSEQTKTELLDSVCEEAERLEHLVANLLDMTRLDSGDIKPKREWVPVSECVGGALARMDQKLAAHHVAIALSEGLPLISVDPILMEQLLFNLLENAAKYTPPGSRIEIRAYASKDAVVLEIQDNGPGIPRGQEEKIFERFHRATSTGVFGVGLGLAICRAIAVAHTGTLTAHASAQGGALFRLTLPSLEPPPDILSTEALRSA